MGLIVMRSRPLPREKGHLLSTPRFYPLLCRREQKLGWRHLFFANHLKNCIFADPFLTLKGLNEILLFQNT